ncbi:MAG: Ni/Fe hydrogenase subunit alpha [Bacillota bacterium]|nr:Ni/Fe hydrogenase subunit alpha [Bacillota bacterium]
MERITVAHLARVEGHGGIDVTLAGDRVADVNFDIFEGSRFFEQLLVGRTWDQVPGIVCRVCAICSAGHYVTALKAVEDALGIKVSPQTEALRELLFLGQMIESHALHLFCLAVPDFLGYGGVIPLANDRPDEVRLGLSLKKLGNELQTAVGGRPVHAVNAIVGGFGKLPDPEVLRSLGRRLGEALEQAPAVVALFASLTVPNHSESPTIYVALEPEGEEFSFFGRRIVASTGETFEVHDYRRVTNETVVGHSHAKHSRLGGRPYMVGSLARLHHWADRLTPRARAVAREIGLTLPTENILYNNHAQAVELVWSLERAAGLIDELLTAGMKEETPVEVVWSEPRKGTAATEVPRGTLYHSYEFDAAGRVTAADIITPTAQNLANVEKDIRACAEKLAGKPDGDLVNNFEMIVRAYDPCISCSVHLIRLA